MRTLIGWSVAVVLVGASVARADWRDDERRAEQRRAEQRREDDRRREDAEQQRRDDDRRREEAERQRREDDRRRTEAADRSAEESRRRVLDIQHERVDQHVRWAQEDSDERARRAEAQPARMDRQPSAAPAPAPAPVVWGKRLKTPKGFGFEAPGVLVGPGGAARLFDGRPAMRWQLKSVANPENQALLVFTEFGNESIEEAARAVFDSMIGADHAAVSSESPVHVVEYDGGTLSYRDFFRAGPDGTGALRAYLWGNRLVFTYQACESDPTLSPARNYFAAVARFAPFQAGFQLTDEPQGQSLQRR